jgi:hypothetical protein
MFRIGTPEIVVLCFVVVLVVGVAGIVAFIVKVGKPGPGDLIACPGCREAVSPEETTCPHCGAALSRSS